MDGLIQPNLNPTTERQDSSLRPILIGIVIVGIVVGILALIFRAEQKKPAAPPAYAANLKFSDLKTSAAQNFVGATVSYLDGVITNTGNRGIVELEMNLDFRDLQGKVMFHDARRLYGQGATPLAAGEKRDFELAFENVPPGWDQRPPDITITGLHLQ